MQKKIALLGSTGSIGTQALDVVSKFPDVFRVTLLTANNNISLLTEQALRFHPETVVISNGGLYNKLKENLKNTGINILAGDNAIGEAVSLSDADIVLAAIVGYSGLSPVLSAVRSGKSIALANKETLVVAGEIITRLASETGSRIIPVDSEHSAIFQCLEGEERSSVEKITLTASGGPFLKMSLSRLKNVRPEDALKHPNWNMGDKVTIDSASMMNKGLEVIEARWLFDLEPGQIGVAVHPQSIIHSLVHFIDGSVKAQMSLPDMRIPILYALGHPQRYRSDIPRLDLSRNASLTFEEPDIKRFRNLSLAYRALSEGGNMPCALNASNEIAVRAFLAGRIGFLQMPDIVEHTLDKCDHILSPDIESLASTDKLARDIAETYVKKLQNGL